jgi:hypothetical protein
MAIDLHYLPNCVNRNGFGKLRTPGVRDISISPLRSSVWDLMQVVCL